jgi:AcrR family transcriptional regulator
MARRSKPKQNGTRRYYSPLRRQQHAETREGIVAAGAKLAHRLPSWDWKELSFGAVAERAGISKRTVYRHFANEQELRTAILRRLVEESGVQLEGLELRNYSALIERLSEYLTSFSVTSPAPAEATFADVEARRRGALVGAMKRAAPEWSKDEQEMAAAVLDMMMLWCVPPYERLMAAWRFEPKRAVRTITWLLGLIEEAVRTNRRPNG